MVISNIFLIVVIIPFFLGVFWVYGTWKNWKVFMDPSDDLWFMWFWHLIRKHFGEEGMKVLNYSFGISLISGGVYLLSISINRLNFLGY